MDSQEFKGKLEGALSLVKEAKRMQTERLDKIINLKYVIEKLEDYIFRAECRIKSEEEEEKCLTKQ